MFDTLIDRKTLHVAGVCQTACSVQCLQVTQHLRVAVRVFEAAINKIGAGKMDLFFGNGFAGVIQE